jgi:hypothetical protein
MGAAGRTALTIVGQVAGAYFGPIGSAIGGMIGASIGGALWPEQIEGPRLEGLQITSSSYGWPIPEVYGTVRTAGNIVWRYPLDTYYEVATTEQQGKGGGPEVTTYTYYLDFAILLCEGPIAGVRRVWADQKLIYDVSAEETSPGPDGLPKVFGSSVEQLIASVGGKAVDMRVYLGTEDQLPDPTIEAQVGVGNTPAYRGYAYLVFPYFNLTDFGNRIPNITVEVVRGVETTGPRLWFERNWGLSYESGALSQFARIVSTDGALVAVPAKSSFSRGWASELDGTNVRAVVSPTYNWPNNTTSPLDIFANDCLLLWNGADAIYTLALPATNASLANRQVFSVMECVVDDAELRTYTTTGGVDWSEVLSDTWGCVIAIVPCADQEHVIVLLCPDDVGIVAPTRWVMFRWEAGFVEVDRGTIDGTVTPYRAAGAVTCFASGAMSFSCGMMERDLRHVWIGSSTASFDNVILLEIDDAGVLRQVHEFTANLGGLAADVSIYADGGVCWFKQGDYLHAYNRIPTLPLGMPTLAAVVTDICESTGLHSSDLNVADLESTLVRGYSRSARMSGRAAIEPLMTAYAFDGVESDLKIKWRLRGAAVDVTIPSDDLGASDSGERPAVESERAQESELPQAIDLSYIDADADYQVGTQIAQRLAVTSEERLSVRLAVALQAWEAAAIVHRMLFELWVARSTRKFSTTLKYAKYEPTDVIAVDAPDGARYTVRALDKRESGQAIEWVGVDVDAAGFNPSSTPATSPGGGTVEAAAPPADFVAADLPPLREQDFGTFGWYVGAGGIGPTTWPGAVIYTSTDGVTFDPVKQVATAAALGAATSVLGRWGFDSGDDDIFAGHTVDFQSFVEVTISSGTLSSCTFDELLALTNAAMIGDELVAFMTATLISTGVYRLSGFLRGLQGTEAAAAASDGHAIGEPFLLLTEAAVRRVTDVYSAAQQDLHVKAVTAGRSVALASAKTLERTGASAVPPAPSHTVGRKSGSDLVVNFTRRSYVGGTWDNGRDVPALATEEYAIHVVLTGGAGKTFLRSGPAPHTITAAELATIGATVAGVAFYVAQIPPATPGSTALLDAPATRPNFWSRRTSVTW